MIRTIFFLITCLLILPFVALRYDTPLSMELSEALKNGVYLMIGVALTCFVTSELTRNCSQVDKLWSIIPIVYVWYFAYQSHFNTRLVLMAILVTIWGIRLTYNFARRGGYHWIPWQGEEDYRWAVLRDKPFLNTRFGWALFNLGFISLYQNGLILLFTLPIVVAWQGADTPLGAFDFLIAVIMLGLIAVETIADQQQYDFQEEKYRRIRNNEPLTGEYLKGFCATGLWAKMRHPNYAAEQSIWLAFYFFSVAATGRWLNWSLAGALLLMLLFIGSSDFSEKISSEKYPDYKDYQKKTPRFLPRF
jgi:steroid 5-alpha reductase family enzyme